MLSFGTQPRDVRWKDIMDITGPQNAPDGRVDQFDMAAVVKRLLEQTVPPNFSLYFGAQDAHAQDPRRPLNQQVEKSDSPP